MIQVDHADLEAIKLKCHGNFPLSNLRKAVGLELPELPRVEHAACEHHDDNHHDHLSRQGYTV